MHNLKQPADAARRVPALDALRGIAAFIVLFHHSAMAVGVGRYPAGHVLFETSPLNILIAGRGAVVLFFVLSGYALALALRKGVAYPVFAVRRVCRIYLPFLAAIGLAILLYPLIQDHRIAALSDWFNRSGATPLTLHGALANILMLGRKDDIFLDGPMWSLIHEMRISLVFPLLLLCLRRRPLLVGGAYIVLYPLVLFACEGLGYSVFLGGSLHESAMATGYFVCFFIVGILVARYERALVAWIAARSRAAVLLLGLAAWACFCFRSDLLAGCGSVIVMALTLGRTGARRFLEIRPLAAAGRISFSLYLTHMIVMPLVFSRFYGAMPVPVLLVLNLGISVAVAAGFYRLVEKPCLRLSRWVGQEPLWLQAQESLAV